MSSSSPELLRLLGGEIARRLPLFEREDSQERDLGAALHSLRGSASLAGQPDLALVMAQAWARLCAGDRRARAEIRSVLQGARARLERGQAPFATAWPEPPPGLCPSRVELRYRLEYLTAMRDRLGEMDAVLASTDGAVSGLDAAERCVHAMKGAAAAVGDEVMAWYCHGLESRLHQALRTERAARDSLVELARHRPLLALLAEDSSRGLSALLAVAAAEKPGLSASREPKSRNPAESALQSPGSLRVSASFIDGFSEQLARLDVVHDDLGRANLVARRIAVRLRDVRSTLMEALQVLGSEKESRGSVVALGRVESAASALRNVIGSTERGAHGFRRSADFLRARTEQMRALLSGLRRTTLGWLFERVASAARRFAESEFKLIEVELSGADLAIDRAVAERLFDGLVQLVKNAVTHGIQQPDQRKLLGRSPGGRLRLRGERRGEWLRILVEDDGQGVDLGRVRELAVESNVMSEAAAALAHESELFAVLFLPGVTTQAAPDFLAGRGLGLELVQEALRRLGGSIRLERGGTGGVTAILEIPSDQALLEVLWLEEDGQEFALAVSHARSVRLLDRGTPCVRLGWCLGRRSERACEMAVELEVQGVEPVWVGVERALGIEEVTVRSIPSSIAATGPFSGAVLRSDGSLRLFLDAPLLAARVWARA